MLTKNSLINLNYQFGTLKFDAAIDLGWNLHCYDLDLSEEDKQKVVPVELYCYDRPDWDVTVVYLEQDPRTLGVKVDFNEIIKATAAWVKEWQD